MQRVFPPHYQFCGIALRNGIKVIWMTELLLSYYRVESQPNFHDLLLHYIFKVRREGCMYWVIMAKVTWETMFRPWHSFLWDSQIKVYWDQEGLNLQSRAEAKVKQWDSLQLDQIHYSEAKSVSSDKVSASNSQE